MNNPPGNSFDHALAHHQAGRLAQAEPLYRQILAENPNHPDALHMLGVVLYQQGRPTEAVDLIRQAIALNPGQVIYLSNLALILTELGQTHQAADVCRQAVCLQPDSADLLNNLGNALLANQQFQDAADAYARAAALLPDSPELYGNLGTALLQSGNAVDAEQAYRRSLALRPADADAQYNLGLACGMQSCWDAAIEAFRQAIRLRPNHAEAANNLGNALSEKARYAEAERAYGQAIALRSDYAQPHSNLGIALYKLGRCDEAVAEYQHALALRPGNPNTLYHLANALKDQGRHDEAIAALHNALALRPDHAESYVTLSLLHADHNRWDEALAAANQAAAVQPKWAGAHNNLGFLLRLQGRTQEAMPHFRKALDLDPRFREAYINLGTVFHELGKIDEALAAHEQALSISADTVEGLVNYSNSLKDAGRLTECIAACRQAQSLTTDPLKVQNLLLAIHYDPNLSAEQILEENRRWGAALSARVAAERKPPLNAPEPDRRLKVGYVSADFRHHVLGYNILPLLEQHDHSQVEVFCYSNTPREDEITARFRTLAHHWRDIKPLSDAQAAEHVRQDGIDILVDLSLHTAGNRLGIFARKPAPVQVTFAGYPGTTGLPEIDYRLTDRYLDPPSTHSTGSGQASSGHAPGTDALYTEKSHRLPNSFWCYRPLNRDQTVGPLPALVNGFVTFGALTNFCKINDRVLSLWSNVLAALPDSQLLLISRTGSHRDRVKATFATRGIDPHRIEFLDYLPRAQYLETYNRIDLGLDTFPYNGHTTSLDSFWMGVPVITLVGQTVVGRAGLCQLMNLGLPELVARDEAEFVEIALKLATDLPRLAQLRATLRPRMERSPLMDAKGFAISIENAYRTMWRDWCQTRRLATDEHR